MSVYKPIPIKSRGTSRTSKQSFSVFDLCMRVVKLFADLHADGFVMNDAKIDNILIKQTSEGLKFRFGDLDLVTTQAIKRSDYIKSISCNLSQYDH